MRKKRFLVWVMLGIYVFGIWGCATIPSAIEHRQLYVGAKMSHSIFLDPVKKARLKTVYVEVKNTSQLEKFQPEILKSLLESRLAGKGYRITNDPTQAGYILQVNVRYFDYYRETGAREGAGVGAVAAGVGAASAVSSSDDPKVLIAAALAASLGYVGGAFVGSMISINTFAGVVDLQIMEKTEGPIEQKITSRVQQGESTIIETKQVRESDYQIYRNSVAVTATKTNLKEEEAVRAVMGKLAHEIAGIF